MDSFVKQDLCCNHPDKIFNYDISETIEDWIDDDVQLKFECIHYDLVVIEWEIYGLDVLKKQGYYPLIKELVDKYHVSGTFYRGVDYELDKLKVGYVMDYKRLSSWSTSMTIAHFFTSDENPVMLKLVCKNATGLDLNLGIRFSMENEIILGHYALKIVGEEYYEHRDVTCDHKNTIVSGKLLLVEFFDIFT